MIQPDRQHRKKKKSPKVPLQSVITALNSITDREVDVQRPFFAPQIPAPAPFDSRSTVITLGPANQHLENPISEFGGLDLPLVESGSCQIR